MITNNIIYILIYIILINIVAFFVMLIDKEKAKKNKWRIKESSLLFIALIGGSIGELIGMFKWHHKTQKNRFIIGIPIIIALQILIIIAILVK